MTALIGKRFKNCILVMADKRITYRGTLQYHDEEKKIIMLNKNIMITYAGVKNIIDAGIKNLQKYSQINHSVEEIISQSQKIFCTSLNEFKKSYPGQEYSTVYILSGFKNNDETFVYYFSSDDLFQKRNRLDFFYKTFPDSEMLSLETYLKTQVDLSRNDIDYFIDKFSLAIKGIKNDKISSSVYSIYLTKDEIIEIDINDHNVYTMKKLTHF
jgi:Proteasome subunit